MVELNAVEVGKLLVPVIRVTLHHPDFVLYPPLALERPRSRNIDDAAQIVLIVLKRLFAEDDVPAAGEARHDEVGRSWLGELELDRVLVANVDLAHRAEQDRARD